MIEKRSTILAIDDDITVLNCIRTVLESDYEISLAKNTDIARKILGSTEVDLILLDMNMPDSTGMDFLELIRNDDSWYHIPVIIVSSQGTADIIVEIRKRGAIDFVVKPIAPAKLKEKVRFGLDTIKKRTNRIVLEMKLKILASACASGKTSHIRELVKELEQFIFRKDIDTEIAAICKYAKAMDYNLVEEKIKQVLLNLSGEQPAEDKDTPDGQLPED